MAVKPNVLDETYEDLVFVFGSERKLKETMLRHLVHSLLFIVNVPESKIQSADKTSDIFNLWLDYRRNIQPNEAKQVSQENKESISYPARIHN